MPALHLIVPDPALRAAIIEQLKLARLADVEELSEPTHVVTDTQSAVVLIDEAALDKKTVKALQALDGKKTLLVIGAAEGTGLEDLWGESFPKPARLGHLMTRLQFHLEAAPRLRSKPVTFGPFRLDAKGRQILVEATGAVIRLTEKETALLEYLAEKDANVSREELLAAVWGYDGRIDTHTLETHIYQLRRKLDPDGEGLVWLMNEQAAYRLKRS